jgi:hypothetical protein
LGKKHFLKNSLIIRKIFPLARKSDKYGTIYLKYFKKIRDLTPAKKLILAWNDPVD